MDLQERMLAFTVPHEGLAMGRNGLMRTSGLRVCCFMSGVVIIEPVTSRGQIGNCRIEMPFCGETVSNPSLSSCRTATFTGAIDSLNFPASVRSDHR